MNDTSHPPEAPTVADILGQMVWLLSQSPLHRELKLKDLEWSFMPAILHGQFRIFRYGPLPGIDANSLGDLNGLGMDPAGLEVMPLGVALWAKLSPEAEAKLERNERLTPQEWNSGDRTWLVELISPFAKPENKLTEVMLADLIAGPFKRTPFSLHRTDAASGKREKITFDAHLVPETSPAA